MSLVGLDGLISLWRKSSPWVWLHIPPRVPAFFPMAFKVWTLIVSPEAVLNQFLADLLEDISDSIWCFKPVHQRYLQPQSHSGPEDVSLLDSVLPAGLTKEI